jgi:type I restriction enzyme S subunit
MAGWNPARAIAVVRLQDTSLRTYLKTVLESTAGRHLIDAVLNTTVQKTLNLKDIRKLPIPLPPITEIKGISAISDALTNRITLLRETNATLEAIAQALFKSWFVDFDPVRAKAEGKVPDTMDEATATLFPDGFEESELGVVPKGWRTNEVGEIVEGIYDGPHATPAESDAGPIFLGIKNLTGTGLDLSEVRHIAEDDWAQWTRRVTPRAGDIVFSYEATLGFFALLPRGIRCCLGRRLALIRPTELDGCGHFLFHQFVSAPFQQLLAKHTIQGATVNRIALKQFPSYPVLNPPTALKLVFDNRVSPLWARIHENQSQAQTLAALRDTLLPRLISGQLRLPDALALTGGESA